MNKCLLEAALSSVSSRLQCFALMKFQQARYWSRELKFIVKELRRLYELAYWQLDKCWYF